MDTSTINLEEEERLYLGGLLEAAGRAELDQAFDDSAPLAPGDFYKPEYGRIYGIILKQYHEGVTPDLITIAQEYPEIRYNASITTLPEGSIGGYYNIKLYSGRIRAASRRRNLTLRLRQALDDIEKGAGTEDIAGSLLEALAPLSTSRNEAAGKTAGTLLDTDYPPVRWIVPGLIGEGLTMINGAPKIGKSWFSLGLGIASAAGGRFLGKLKVEKPTASLYLALEDTERRLHDRLKMLHAPRLENFTLFCQWHNGAIGLDNYLDAHKDTGLVIIDTLARFANDQGRGGQSGRINDFNDYGGTYGPTAALKAIADKHGTAVVLIHHAKKAGSRKQSAGTDWMENALGSTGLSASTDSTIFIARDRDDEGSKTTGSLYATGRDAADLKYNIRLDFDAGGWVIADKKTGGKTKERPQPKARRVITMADVDAIFAAEPERIRRLREGLDVDEEEELRP
jgi:hypothetical protein